MMTMEDFNRTICRKTGYLNDKGYQDIVNENISRITDADETAGDGEIVINRRTDHGFTYGQIEKILRKIDDDARCGYTLNIGFGFILYNTITDEFKYFFDTRHHMLYENGVTINQEEDLLNFLNEVSGFDLVSKYYLNVPSSTWVLAGITNVQIKVKLEKSSRKCICECESMSNCGEPTRNSSNDMDTEGSILPQEYKRLLVRSISRELGCDWVLLDKTNSLCLNLITIPTLCGL